MRRRDLFTQTASALASLPLLKECEGGRGVSVLLKGESVFAPLKEQIRQGICMSLTRLKWDTLLPELDTPKEDMTGFGVIFYVDQRGLFDAKL